MPAAGSITTLTEQRADVRLENSVKRRAACDQCRNKKLKCSGEQPICERCRKECIDCVYSVQKQMGRPKKRRRSLETDNATSTSIPQFAPTRNTSYVEEVPQIDGNSTSTPMAQEGLSPAYDDVGLGSLNIAFSHGPPITTHISSSWNPPEDNQSSLYSLPGLMMDMTKNSSVAVSLAPELATTQTHDDAAVEDLFSMSMSPTPGSHNNLAPAAQVSAMPSCACLSTMYLTLASLTSMDAAAPFPYSLHPLREAMQGAAEILACKECPKQFFTGMQNTNAMNSLIAGIAERFSQVLVSITAEAERAEAADELKKFRLADLQMAGSHLHTGGLGCIAAFTISLSPREWRTMCKKVVRAEVFGPSDGNNCCSYLTGLMSQMEARQLEWHARPHEHASADREPLTGNVGSNATLAEGDKPQDFTCLRMISFARQMFAKYDWS